MKITIKNLQKKAPISPKEVRKTILRVLSRERAKKTGEITVCFVGDKKIRELNNKFLKKNEATDVLAFDGSAPLTINPEPFGSAQGKLRRRIDLSEAFGPKHIFADIIISTDTALRNAKAFRTDVSREINLYVIHGILHILGYDDLTTGDKKLMREKEKEYAD